MRRALMVAAALCALSGPLNAQTKVSALPSGSAVGGSELIVGDQAGSTVTLTPAQLATYFDGLLISGTPTTGDCVAWASATALADAGASCGAGGGLSAIGANTLLGNFTGSSAVPSANSIPSCSTASSALTYTTATGFGCNSISGSVPANLTLTSPASAATFTLLGGKTFTVNNGLTLAGTDGTTMTFPTTTAVIARTDAAQTFTNIQSFSSVIQASAGIRVNASGTSYQLGTASHIFAVATVPTCSAVGGSPTCVMVANTGSAGQEMSLSLAGSATAMTITQGTAASNGWICNAYDLTTTTIRLKMTSNTTTTATLTFYNDAGTATSPGASDVIWASCVGV